MDNSWLDEKHVYVGNPPPIPDDLVIERDGVIVSNDSEYARQFWEAIQEMKKSKRGEQKPLRFNKRGKVMR